MQLHIISEKPKIAEGLNVFNAPRPIPGVKEWEGDFLHGIFYASNPLMTTELMNLDAWQVNYYTIKQAKDIIKTAYPQFIEKIMSLDDSEIKRIFNYFMNKHAI